MARVIMFCFAGRRENLELQLPMVRRIIDDNPDVEMHYWDVTKHTRDNNFLRDLRHKHVPRIDVHQEFTGRPWSPSWMNIWRHYARPEYAGCTFVKLDDDVVFFETERFPDFIAASQANPGLVISADTINNAACVRLHPQLADWYKSTEKPLLDWHLSVDTADQAHNYFFDHWRDITTQPIQLVPTQDWLSINCIAYTWKTGKYIADHQGTPPPKHIAGRDWNPDTDRLGDDGVTNMCVRAILQGFTVCHLTFGPQWKAADYHLMAGWRQRYAGINAEYLAEQSAHIPTTA